MIDFKECVKFVKDKLLNYVKEHTNIFVDFVDEEYNSCLEEFIEYSTPEELEEVYKNILNKYGDMFIEQFDKENNVNTDDYYWDILNELNSNDMLKKVHDLFLEFANKHIDDPKFNKYLTNSQLKELNDEIGDKITNYTNRDYDNREKCFIDINGEIIVSDEGETHATLVNKYLDSVGKETFENDYYRPAQEELENMVDKFGFGEIDNDIFFVEDDTFYGNMSAKEIIDDIMKSGIDYEKIYTIKNNKLTRVANNLM